MRTAIPALLVACSIAACGGKTRPEQTYDVHSHGVGEKHDIEEEHHGVGVAEIDKFHDTLAPIWHAPAGDDRKHNACTAVPTMKDQAALIVGRARTDHAGWEGNGNALAAAVTKLGTVCADPTLAGFDDAFGAVHDAYHGLMESAMPADQADHMHVGH